jgi:hypothetical protein
MTGRIIVLRFFVLLADLSGIGAFAVAVIDAAVFHFCNVPIVRSCNVAS